MRSILLAVLLLVCTPSHANALCSGSEITIFAFETKSKKKLSICKARDGEYLTYRFGKPGNIEMQFPDTLDSSSWKKFEFSGVRRGGGKANAGFGDYSLVFESARIGYTVFQEWNDEESTYSIGVIVSGAGKPTTIWGLKETQKGSLVLLEKEGGRLSNIAQ